MLLTWDEAGNAFTTSWCQVQFAGGSANANANANADADADPGADLDIAAECRKFAEKVNAISCGSFEESRCERRIEPYDCPEASGRLFACVAARGSVVCDEGDVRFLGCEAEEEAFAQCLQANATDPGCPNGSC